MWIFWMLFQLKYIWPILILLHYLVMDNLQPYLVLSLYSVYTVWLYFKNALYKQNNIHFILILYKLIICNRNFTHLILTWLLTHLELFLSFYLHLVSFIKQTFIATIRCHLFFFLLFYGDMEAMGYYDLLEIFFNIFLSFQS